MSWTYTEQYSEDQSILFTSFIDSEFGDNDGFVSAWELLKMDVSSRKLLLDTLEENMDVKVNGSSDSIKPVIVESEMSVECLGPVNGEESIVNIYEVYYTFEEPIPSLGNKMWFLGEPDTDVTIHLPENIRVVSTEGIDNVSIDSDNSGPSVSGKFGFTGEAEVYFEMNEIDFEEKEPETIVVPSAEYEGESFSSLVDEIFPGLTEEFLETLKGSSLI